MPIKRLEIKIPGSVVVGKKLAKPSFMKPDDIESEHLRTMRSSARWQKLREYILSRTPFCHVCRHPATVVHHIVMATHNSDLFFKESNLCPLCDECHKKIHDAYRRGYKPEQLFNKENSPCQE